MSIADRMKKIRGLMTQKDFAEKIGLTSQAILNYERHGRTPKKAVVSKVCEIFGVSEGWLLTGEGPMSSPSAASDSEKMGDMSPIEKDNSLEKLNNIKQKWATVSHLDIQQENATLNRELRDLLRENGDLRVDIERKKARIAELERELVRVLKGEEAEDMASAG